MGGKDHLGFACISVFCLSPSQHLHTTTVESSRSLALGHCEWNAFALVGSASRQHSV